MLDHSEKPANTSPTATLYKELPYPADGVMRTTNARLMLAGMKEHAPGLLQREKLRIIDVGCGTGENTVALAKYFPQAEVFGADINPASLELAGKLADRHALPIKFVHCDIARNLADNLRAASPGPFDLVCSIGVLHHLAQPRDGFAAVRQIVHPDGLLYCMVYSHFGRREEMATKSLLNEVLPGNTSWKKRADAIAELRLENLHSVWSGIKRVRNRLKIGPPLQPLELLQALLKRNNLVHMSDTYSNPCEHLYRFRELEALLAETGWQFVALARHAGLPTTPEEHTRRASERAYLRQMSPAAMYDYFAFYYEVTGFTFFSRPRHDSQSAGPSDH
jgi:SAM-dependent methyltransferase